MGLYETEGIGRYISYLHRLGASFLSNEFDKYELGYGQYQFLIRLYLNDGISHDELTEQVNVDKAATTRAIKKLEEKGYVKLVQNETDKRKYHIFLTDKAMKERDEILIISKRWEDQLIGGLDKNELDELYILLRKICKYNSAHLFGDEEK